MSQVEAAWDFNLRDVFYSVLSRIDEGSLVAIEDHLKTHQCFRVVLQGAFEVACFDA
jgi:hypothetical protein